GIAEHIARFSVCEAIQTLRVDDIGIEIQVSFRALPAQQRCCGFLAHGRVRAHEGCKKREKGEQAVKTKRRKHWGPPGAVVIMPDIIYGNRGDCESMCPRFPAQLDNFSQPRVCLPVIKFRGSYQVWNQS